MHTEDILGLDVPNEGPLFAAVLLLHVLAGLTCVVSGTLAATARKRPGRHPRAGRVYLVGISVIVATATTMAIVRWDHSAYLLILAIVLAALGTLGWLSRPSRRPALVTWHAIGMGGSFIVLLTGFYVDNGARLPLWDRLPPLAFWVIPAAVGIPSSSSHSAGIAVARAGSRVNACALHANDISLTHRHGSVIENQ